LKKPRRKRKKGKRRTTHQRSPKKNKLQNNVKKGLCENFVLRQPRDLSSTTRSETLVQLS
jgi:hypothetical protein